MVRMVVDSILSHAECGPNDHRNDAPPFFLADNTAALRPFIIYLKKVFFFFAELFCFSFPIKYSCIKLIIESFHNLFDLFTICLVHCFILFFHSLRNNLKIVILLLQCLHILVLGSLKSSIYDRTFKGSSDSHTHFIFEINVGKRRIRDRTTLKLNFQIN